MKEHPSSLLVPQPSQSRPCTPYRDRATYRLSFLRLRLRLMPVACSARHSPSNGPRQNLVPDKPSAKPSCPSLYPLSTLSAPRSLLPLPLAQRPSTSPTSSSSSQPHPLSPLTRLSASSHSQNTTRPKTSSAAPAPLPLSAPNPSRLAQHLEPEQPESREGE